MAYKVTRSIVVGAAVTVLISLCSCSGILPATPTDPTPTQTQPPKPPQCSIALWGCTSTYGAIAYGDGYSGIAYNYSSQGAANAAALGYCAHGTCSVVLQFQDSCGAIATAPTGQAGWASAPSGDFAQAQALAYCVGQ